MALTALEAAQQVMAEATAGSVWLLNSKAYQLAHYAKAAALATSPMGECGGATFAGLSGEATHIHLVQGTKMLVAAELQVPIKPTEGMVKVTPGWVVDTDGDRSWEAMADRAESLGAAIREVFGNV